MSHPLRVVVVVAAGVLVAGCGSSAHGHEQRPADRLVLVSGRDDHGLVAEKRVPVFAAPQSSDRAGLVADGTLARVTEVDGQWLHVATVEGPRVRGWVDDFYLRGVVHLVGPAPSCRATVGGRRVTAGLQVVVQRLSGSRVKVRSVTQPTLRGWADRDAVQELAPQGTDCGDHSPGSVHTH